MLQDQEKRTRWCCRRKFMSQPAASGSLLRPDCNHVAALQVWIQEDLPLAGHFWRVARRRTESTERFICASPVRSNDGKTTEESVHSSVSLHAVRLRDHDGTEDLEAQRRLLGSGSRCGAAADDRGEDGPALRVPWRQRVPGSSPPGWQQHQSSFVQLRPRGDHILRCPYFLLHLVRQPAPGRQIHPLGPHPGAALGPQNRVQLPERETHAAGGHRLQFLPRAQPVQLEGSGRVGVPHGADRAVCGTETVQRGIKGKSEFLKEGGKHNQKKKKKKKEKQLSVVFNAQQLHRSLARVNAKLRGFCLKGH